MLVYLDTSALAKLVVTEAESDALRTWLQPRSDVLVTSDLARTELLRAVRRTVPDRAGAARALLDSLHLRRLTPQLCDAAARLEPPDLRSLDAIHLAAALDLGDDLESLVTYDERLASSARAYGVAVDAPGR